MGIIGLIVCNHKCHVFGLWKIVNFSYFITIITVQWCRSVKENLQNFNNKREPLLSVFAYSLKQSWKNRMDLVSLTWPSVLECQRHSWLRQPHPRPEPFPVRTGGQHGLSRPAVPRLGPLNLRSPLLLSLSIWPGFWLVCWTLVWGQIPIWVLWSFAQSLRGRGSHALTSEKWWYYLLKVPAVTVTPSPRRALATPLWIFLEFLQSCDDRI